MSTSLSSSSRPPCAQRARTICGRAAAKKLVGALDLDHRAAHRSCTAGEPGTILFRRTCRRQCAPARRYSALMRESIKRFFFISSATNKRKRALSSHLGVLEGGIVKSVPHDRNTDTC